MIFVRDMSDAVHAWAEARLGREVGRGVAIGVWSPVRQRLVGAMILNDRTRYRVEATFVGSATISRSARNEVARIAFDDLGVEAVVLHTPVGSKRNRSHTGRLARKLGFHFEGKARCFYSADGDALVWSMTKAEALARGHYDARMSPEAARELANWSPASGSVVLRKGYTVAANFEVRGAA